MSPSDRILIIGGPHMEVRHHMALISASMASMVSIVSPEHIAAPALPPVTEMALHCRLPDKMDDWQPRQTRRERTHPNEPFYRKLQRGRW